MKGLQKNEKHAKINRKGEKYKYRKPEKKSYVQSKMAEKLFKIHTLQAYMN